LQPGTKAPPFTFHEADGTECHTDDLKGTLWLVYFYPKDDTPGCTKEACAFRDDFEQFRQAGVTVIGVSADDEHSHEKFRQKYDLPFALAADPEKHIIRAYGVWGEKKFMGKVYEGIHRMSFLVNKAGQIAKTYPKVKPQAHASEVLQDAQTLI